MPEGRPLFPRSSGILLHPTSLPGPDGIGDLGDAAFGFVDWLEKTGQSLWQILPLGPTSFGDSPYQTLSAFAGNPLLISLDRLVRDGWLDAADLADGRTFRDDRVDFGAVIAWKTGHARPGLGAVFSERPARPTSADFAAFRDAGGGWLDDFALFMALKEDHAGAGPGPSGSRGCARREPDALAAARRTPGRTASAAHRFRQWLFFTQWERLKNFAGGKGVRLIGDAPIFVAHDSSDVWANREIFLLDAKGRLACQAGVPPDYFSATGQLWGNPLYDWDKMAGRRLRLVGAPRPRLPASDRPGAHRPLPRLRGLLGGACRRGDRRRWPVGPRPGPRVLREPAAPARRAAHRRRGPGRDHAGGGGTARRLRHARA